MQKLVRVVIAAALIGLVFWGWRTLFPTPERVIRSRLQKLAATLSFEPKDGELLRAFQAQNLTEFFTPDATLQVDIRGYGQRTLNGRDELQQAALVYLHAIRGLKVELLDINVTLDADKQSAVANLTGKATVLGESDFYVQEFNFKLKKVDGKWLIYKVETVKTLSQSRNACHPLDAGRCVMSRFSSLNAIIFARG
jgi:hypothetical protein